MNDLILTNSLKTAINRLSNEEAGIFVKSIISSQTNKQKRGKPLFSSTQKGVTWDKMNNRWRARVKINGKDKHVGLYDTEEEAIKGREYYLLNS